MIQDLRKKPFLLQPSPFSPQGSQSAIKAGSGVHTKPKTAVRLTQTQITS